MRLKTGLNGRFYTKTLQTEYCIKTWLTEKAQSRNRMWKEDRNLWKSCTDTRWLLVATLFTHISRNDNLQIALRSARNLAGRVSLRYSIVTYNHVSSIYSKLFFLFVCLFFQFNFLKFFFVRNFNANHNEYRIANELVCSTAQTWPDGG